MRACTHVYVCVCGSALQVVLVKGVCVLGCFRVGVSVFVCIRLCVGPCRHCLREICCYQSSSYCRHRWVARRLLLLVAVATRRKTIHAATDTAAPAGGHKHLRRLSRVCVCVCAPTQQYACSQAAGWLLQACYFEV